MWILAYNKLCSTELNYAGATAGLSQFHQNSQIYVDTGSIHGIHFTLFVDSTEREHIAVYD